jgi:hypothetical protein
MLAMGSFFQGVELGREEKKREEKTEKEGEEGLKEDEKLLDPEVGNRTGFSFGRFLLLLGLMGSVLFLFGRMDLLA